MFGNFRAYLPKALVLAALGLLTAGGIAEAETAPPVGYGCEQGEFCAWSEEFYGGSVQFLDLRTANPGECIPLGGDARSFVNRLDRDVTVYQGEDCSTEGDFTTYPGGGTFVPHAPFVVRAIQIWDY
ncbi:peptidase inhibitor family I36 protein [Amycolatopsis thermoflava]|uniref:peptidase inhibitor family I36 protein n=1 Tax=Amycolatopsis thermoflava TaxID=84480 RepID=UPI003D7110A7